MPKSTQKSSKKKSRRRPSMNLRSNGKIKKLLKKSFHGFSRGDHLVNHLKLLAEDFLARAYAPYSKFSVGAAVMTDTGIYGGCNIENASFGATVCAERTAILKAVSQGARKVTHVYVATPTKEPTPPCALCLQMLAEFCEPDAVIYFANLKDVVKHEKFKSLLKIPFGPKNLRQVRMRSRD